jgi:N-acetylmuramoyl-L-alanine amidase
MVLYRRGLLVCAALAVLLSLSAARGQAAPRPLPPAGGPNYTVGGVVYTDARMFFARYGFRGSWLPGGRSLRFQSAKMRIEIEADKRDAIFNGLRVLLGDPVIVRGNALYLSRIDAEKLFAPVLNPAGVPTPPAPVLRVIAIDPGHGGQDTGTQNKALKLNEKTFTLDVALRLRRLLVAEGYKVVMTRTDDRFIPLPQRADIANQAGADLFISIHFNSAEGAVRGTETYAMTPQFQRSTSTPNAQRDAGDVMAYPGNRNDPWNAVLGYHMQSQVLGKLDSVDRGFKRARFAVLRLVNSPAVLVESGYLSDDAEARKICTVAYRDNIAEGIAAGIRAYALAITTAKTP